MNGWINKPISRLVFFICFVMVFAYFSDIYAENKEKSFMERQRPPVNFLDAMHDMHMDSYECLTCHHRYENGENVLDESELEEGNPDISCSACHNSEAKIELREAFHGQCIECHDRHNDQEGGSLPILCGECHVRHVDNNQMNNE